MKVISPYMYEYKLDMLKDYKTLANMKDFWKDAADIKAGTQQKNQDIDQLFI